MRWGLSGRTPEFSVWVLVLGVLIVVVIGQQQQHPPQQQPHVEPNLGEPRGSSHHPLTSITGTDPTLADQLSQSPPNTRTSQSAQTKASGDNIEVLEASLLKVFGMRRRPRPTGKAHVPQYLLDLYRQHSSDTNDDVSLNFNVRGTPTHSANTVRSFYHKGESKQATYSKILEPCNAQNTVCRNLIVHLVVHCSCLSVCLSVCLSACLL